jgi:hypothetical protein
MKKIENTQAKACGYIIMTTLFIKSLLPSLYQRED